MSRVVALSLLVLGLTGCLRQGTYTAARPLDAGRHELAVRANGLGVTDFADEAGIIPQGALRYRYGIDGTQDVGVGLGTDGVSLMYKRALRREGTRLSLAPEAGGLSLGGVSLAFLQVPLLIGWDFGADHEFTVGPRIGVFGLNNNSVWGGDDDIVVLPTAGVTVGATYRLGRLIRLVPEVALTWPPAAFEDEVRFNPGFFYFEAGLALLFEFGGSG